MSTIDTQSDENLDENIWVWEGIIDPPWLTELLGEDE